MTFSMSHKTIWLICGGSALLGLVIGFIGPIPGAIFMGAIGTVAGFKLYNKAKQEHARQLAEDAEIVAATQAVASRVHVVEVADGDDVYLEVDWREQLEEIESAWKQGDYEFARDWLQKLAYRLKSEEAPEAVHDRFKALMVNFTRDDPLYTEVMRIVLPVIADNPGIVQSQLAKQFPQFDAEQFRYAMYYAAEIGDVLRIKKGRSYTLSIPT